MLPQSTMESLLESLTGRRVLVIGDLILDHYVVGEVDRVSPEAPVPVVLAGSEDADSFELGGSANVARNVASLGGVPLITGIVGMDAGADRIRKLLESHGFDPSRVVAAPDRPTTVKTRVMASHRRQQIVRVDRESVEYAGPETEKHLIAAVDSLLPEADVVVFEDYDKGCITPGLIDHVVSRSRVPVCCDPKFRNFPLYRGLCLVKPNMLEAERFLGRSLRPGRDDDAMRAAGEIRERLAASCVLLTLGEHGSVLSTADDAGVHFPSVAHHVFDVSGAGDTVIATAALGIAAGIDLRDVARMACFAAAAACAEPGVYAVLPEDVIREADEFRRRHGHPAG
ncbi:hypothetical protein JW921_02380 [Candidatus Fermentibacterales bacterium]|nr:hypothetical protein [Candidatus Fermentibacterales bacterium]